MRTPTLLVCLAAALRAQAAGEPPPPSDLPEFWTSTVDHIEKAVAKARRGDVRKAAVSPGGLPVYAVSYGAKDDLRSQANYNSAVAARNPAYYAVKDRSTRPVVSHERILDVQLCLYEEMLAYALENRIFWER